MADLLKVALAGCGGLGRAHARNVEASEGVRLVAVCDVVGESAAELAAQLESGPKPYADHRAMLAAEKPDAVLVVTPNHTHSRISTDAAASGAHVFCEKPMALTVGDCDAMIRAAEQSGVFLMIGYIRRFQAAYMEMKRRVDRGDVGEITLAHAVRLGTGAPGGVGGWQTRKENYGGMFSMYSHELDQLAWLAGEVRAVNAVMKYGEDPANEIEESIFMGIEFASGAIGSLSSSRVYPVNSYELGAAGTKGAFKLTAPGGPITFARHGGKSAAIEVPGNNGLADEIAHFFDCIERGEAPRSDGRDGRRVVAVALAAHESARTGKRVEVPLMT
ncbi:MAG: Gfo/Idh/MocA family oxidoreductase [Gemmatimonadota bacterium]|nr:Gfo/Idh/MocA family oxidoreductase [Gemmatimonadota bacterium]